MAAGGINGLDRLAEPNGLGKLLYQWESVFAARRRDWWLVQGNGLVE
jgi:hypothetical protein